MKAECNIPFLNIETSFDEDFIWYAEEMLDQGHLPEITSSSDTNMTFLFDSDPTVETNVRFSTTHIIAISCTCQTFREKGECKHVALAALLARTTVRDNIPERTSAVTYEEHVLSELTMDDLLKNVDPQRVVEVLRQQLRNFPQVSFALKTALIRDVRFSEGFNKYDVLLRQAIHFDVYGKLSMSKREIGQYIKNCQVLLSYLEDAVAEKQFEEAFHLIEALLKRLHILQFKMPFGSDQLDRILREVYTLAEAFARSDMAPSLRSRLFQFGCELAESSYYRILSFQHNIFQVIYSIYPERSKAEKLFTVLSEKTSVSGDTNAMALKWHLAPKLVTDWKSRLSLGDLPASELNEILNVLSVHACYDSVLELAGWIEIDNHWPDSELELFTDHIFLAATKANRKLMILRATCLLLSVKPKQSVLENCRRMLDETWSIALPFLLIWTRMRLHGTSSTMLIAFLLKEDGQWPELFHLIDKSGDLEILTQFASPLFSFEQEKTVQLFVDLLSREADNYLGPELNSRILNALRIVEELGPKGASGKIAGMLLKKFPERISLKRALKSQTLEMP